MRCLLLLLALAAAQGRTIGSIYVEGNSRLSAAAVIGASGLKPGAEVAPADLDAVCTRLVDSGFFVSANYRYVPVRGQEKPAIDVTLVVVEVTDLRPSRVQIPGVEEETVWVWLDRNEPLVKKRLPTTDAAEATYIRAIERFMAERLGRKEKVVTRLVADFRTGAQYTMFRPETLPKVAAVRFEGVRSVSATDLEKALGKVAIGSEFTELEFRDWVNANLVPLYENVGCLRVAFPRVSVEPNASSGLTVTTTVQEGAIYRLDALDVAGDDLPSGLAKLTDLKAGDVVNWQTVIESSRKMESALRRNGYLDASSQMGRTLDDQKNLARVTVALRKGKQFKMGELRLTGLDPKTEARNRARWPLRPGVPLDVEAVLSFRIEIPSANGKPKIDFNLVRHTDSDLVDVVYAFH
jgi:hypothetical protein